MDPPSRRVSVLARVLFQADVHDCLVESAGAPRMPPVDYARGALSNVEGREIGLRKHCRSPRVSYFDATSITRLKTPVVTRWTGNALTEDARVNRVGRFPASL